MWWGCLVGSVGGTCNSRISRLFIVFLFVIHFHCAAIFQSNTTYTDATCHYSHYSHYSHTHSRETNAQHFITFITSSHHRFIPPSHHPTTTMADHAMEDVDDQTPIYSAGGYVDDDLDLDDEEDEDIPLVSRPKPTRPKPPSHPSRPPILPPTPLPPPLATDYQLRAAGTSARRDYVIAKFIDRPPRFQDGKDVRLYRVGEDTRDGRRAALEAEEKMHRYYSTYTGRRKLARYQKSGTDYVPERNRKAMKVVLSTDAVAKRLHVLRRERIANEKLRLREEEALRESAGMLAAGLEREKNDKLRKEERERESEMNDQVDSFSGVFDGKIRNSRYALMVMQSNSRIVDVIPVGQYSLFSFRADKLRLPDEDKKAKKDDRMARFQNRFSVAQLSREMQAHDNTGLRNVEGYSEIGIRRNNAKPEVEVKGEDMDFEQDFADDDLAQVDREFVQKPAAKVIDRVKNEKNLLKLIRDEPEVASPPGSPRSDSDEEANNQGDSSKQPSPNSSPSRPNSRQHSPMTMAAQTPNTRITPRGTSPRRSRGNTPRPDIAHLLPPVGVMPTPPQVSSILQVLLAGRQKMLFKEVIRHFDVGTKEKKKHLMDLLKVVAVVTSVDVEVDGKKKGKRYYIHCRS